MFSTICQSTCLRGFKSRASVVRLQDDIWRVESLKSATTPTPETREFFSRMSTDGASPATQREARITGTELQEEEPTLMNLRKRVTKVPDSLLFTPDGPPPTKEQKYPARRLLKFQQDSLTQNPWPQTKRRPLAIAEGLSASAQQQDLEFKAI